MYNVIFVSKVSSETRDILDEGKKKKGLFDKTGFRMGGKFGAAAKMRGLRYFFIIFDSTYHMVILKNLQL